MLKNNKYLSAQHRKNGFVPKKKEDKRTRVAAWVLIILIAFCTVCSFLTLGMTVKNCEEANAEEGYSETWVIIKNWTSFNFEVSINGTTAAFDNVASVSFTSFKAFVSDTGNMYGLNLGSGVVIGYFFSGSYTYFCPAPTSTSYDIWSKSCGQITFFSDTSVSEYSELRKWLDSNALKIDFSSFYEEGYQAGLAEGKEAGYNDGYKKGYNAGYNKGITDSGNYQAGYNAGYNAGYSKGAQSNDRYNEGYEAGLKAGLADLTNSLGFFASGTFYYKCYTDNISFVSRDYSDYKALPSSYIFAYNNGVYFKNYGESLCTLDNLDPDTYNFFVISCDFGLNGASLQQYSIFNVIRWNGEGFYSTGEFGSGCTFSFTDGTYLDLSTADNYFSFVDLTTYLSKKIRRVDFWTSRIDIMFFGLLSNPSYNDAYNRGFNDGSRDVGDSAFSRGFSQGKTVGYNEGMNAAGKYTFLSLISAVVDAPIQAVAGLLNFNLLGFNMLSFFYALLTLAIVIAVVRLIL